MTRERAARHEVRLRQVAVGTVAMAVTSALVAPTTATAVTSRPALSATKVPHGADGIIKDFTRLDYAQYRGSLFIAQGKEARQRRGVAQQLWRTRATGAPKAVTLPRHKLRNVNRPTVAGATLYFVATDRTGVNQIYRTNGTTKVVQVSHWKRAGNIVDVAAAGSKLYVLRRSVTAAGPTKVLWTTSGKEPASLQDVGDAGGNLVPFGTKLAFSQASRTSGTSRAWATNGTRSGTVALTPVRQGLSVKPVSAVGTKVVVQAPNDQGTSTLWSSSGTAAGTVAFHEPSSRVWNHLPVGDRFAWVEDDSIWTSDGTPGGTQRRTQQLSDGYDEVLLAGAVGGSLFYLTGPSGNLWKLPAGQGAPSAVTSFRPQQGGVFGTDYIGEDPGYGYSSEFGVSGKRLYFVASDPLHGAELWSTDGGPATMVRDIHPGAGSTAFHDLTPYGKGLVFFARDYRPGARQSLWRTTSGRDRAVMAPVVRVSRKQKQRDSVRVSARFGAGEATRVVARGTVRVGAKSFALARQKVSVPAGTVGRVKLTPASGNRAVLRAVKKWRAAPRAAKKRLAVTAKVTVAFTDPAGNRATRTVTVTLT